MISHFVILLDDLTIGRAQRAVLERALVPLLSVGGSLRRLSEHPAAVPSNWQVELEPAQRTAALLTMLAARIASGPVLWLSAHLVFEANPASAFAAGGPALMGQPGQRLARQVVLAFDPAGEGARAISARAEALLAEDYHAGADWEPEIAPLPDVWKVAPFHAAGRGPLFSCVRFEARPWLNANAPGAPVWRSQLAAAQEQGLIVREQIERDVAERLARPSLLAEADAGFPADLHLSATQLQLDATTPNRALSATPEQLRMIELLRFALPPRKGMPASPRVIEAVTLSRIARRNEEKQKRKEKKPKTGSEASPTPMGQKAVKASAAVNGHVGPHPVFSKAFFVRREIKTYDDLQRWAVSVAARKTAPARSAAASSWRGFKVKMRDPSGLLKSEAFARRNIRSFADLLRWSGKAARYAATHPKEVFRRAKGFVGRRLGGDR